MREQNEFVECFVPRGQRVHSVPRNPDLAIRYAHLSPARQGVPRNVLHTVIRHFLQDPNQRLFLKIGKPGSGKSELKKAIAEEQPNGVYVIEAVFTKAHTMATAQVKNDAGMQAKPEGIRKRESRLRASTLLASIARLVVGDHLVDTAAPAATNRNISLKMTMEFPGIPARDSEGEKVERGEVVLQTIQREEKRNPDVRKRHSGVVLVSDRTITQNTIQERQGKGTSLGGSSDMVREIDEAVRFDAEAIAASPEGVRELTLLDPLLSKQLDLQTRKLVIRVSHWLRSLGMVSRYPVLVNRYSPLLYH